MASIGLGQTINGSLTSDDSKYSGSGYSFDRYDFTGLDDYRQLNVTVTRDIGKSFEVILRNATTGEIVDFKSDDFGAGKLSLNATTFPGIKYQVEVNGGSDGFFGTAKGNDFGNYTLSTANGGKATSIISTGSVQVTRGFNTVSVGTVGADGKFFSLASGSGSGLIKDVALSPNGQFYGVDGDTLLRIDPSKNEREQIRPANGIIALSTIQGPVGQFGIKGTVDPIDAIEYANEQLYGLVRTATGGKLYTIDTTTPPIGITANYTATLVGDLPTGFAINGDDFVYDAANSRFLATAKDTATSDALWQIPIANPAGASKIGSIGSTGLTALAFENGQLTGISNKSDGTGTKIAINPTTGAGTIGQGILGIKTITGATTIVGANVTNPAISNPTGSTPITSTPFPTTAAGAIGTKSQGLAEGRIIDLTDYAGKALKVDATTKGDAAYTNNIGFYQVTDALTGAIQLANGTILKPSDANYAAEAIKSAVIQAGKVDSKLGLDVPGGGIYAPVVVAQGSLADFVTKNPTNGGDGSAIHAYFNYLGANPDKFDHFKLTGPNTFSVEDQFGGGDRDFNDLTINMNFKTV
jgi:Domain of unknown function (DUF4114)